ncbi:MAG: hypothetical protein C0392_13650 [Syntrophus sp. (in: bacteria)]|nr:hypothetical protein [Syntrophus sp. (in: bacteria)]
MKEVTKVNPVSWPHSLSSTLVEVIKTGIILTDGNGIIYFTNTLALTLLGYSKDSLDDKSMETLFLPEDTQFFLPNILRMTREGAGFEGEALLRRKNRGTLFVNLSTVLYKGDSLGHEIIIFTIQDITHLKKMEKQYLSSERFSGLGMMTDQISHQIRNPVVSIGGFALRLAKKQISPDEYAQYSTIIHTEAKRLEYIIDRLVEFARIHSTRYAALTLSDIFEGVKNTFFLRPEGNSSVIEFPDPETLPSVPMFGDLPLLIRAVQCIIQNSVEGISTKGTVTVTGSINGNEVLIRVKDTGEGILPEHLPFIFDPFFSTKFNYLGLGLTMARRIVQENKGLVEVESLPGEGTEVRIIMPRDRRREIRTRHL